MAEWSKAPDSRLCTLLPLIGSRQETSGPRLRAWVRIPFLTKHFLQEKTHCVGQAQPPTQVDLEVMARDNTFFLLLNAHTRGYSSVVEHPAAVRQVLGSTPSVPYGFPFALCFLQIMA